MNTDEIRLAIDCAKVLETLMDADQQGVIFCTTKHQAKELHERFTKCSSYSDLPPEERGHYELIWKNHDCRWMASTTGLIQGIDLRNISGIVFLGMPYGLLNIPRVRTRWEEWQKMLVGNALPVECALDGGQSATGRQYCMSDGRG